MRDSFERAFAQIPSRLFFIPGGIPFYAGNNGVRAFVALSGFAESLRARALFLSRPESFDGAEMARPALLRDVSVMRFCRGCVDGLLSVGRRCGSRVDKESRARTLLELSLLRIRASSDGFRRF